MTADWLAVGSAVVLVAPLVAEMAVLLAWREAALLAERLETLMVVQKVLKMGKLSAEVLAYHWVDCWAFSKVALMAAQLAVLWAVSLADQLAKGSHQQTEALFLLTCPKCDIYSSCSSADITA